MIASIASLGAAHCCSLTLKQLVPSHSHLSRVRGSRTSFLQSVDIQQAFKWPDDSQKSAAAIRCGDVQLTDAVRIHSEGKREYGRVVAVDCRASRSPSAESSVNVDDFVEIGIVAETHGVYGELRIRSSTDFPEERFETPGTRWIKKMRMGKPSITEVELIEGRETIGKQTSWLVRLKGVDTLEKASEFQGATMLIRADERPVSLEEDEDYIPDLLGMDVVIQETKETIGTIVDVHNSGASDLLRVQLTKPIRGKDVRIWIPFVKEIVPVVDISSNRVEISPPDGLLDLNVPKEGPSRKESLKMERKRKAILSAIRKRLRALGQTHVLEGLSIGEESQRQSLMDQLMSIDFGLFQQALLNAPSPLSTNSITGELQPPPTVPQANWADFETWSPTSKDNDTARWWYKGLQLVADGEVAVIVLAGGQATRLGPDSPPVKGMLELDLPERKSLFEIQADRLLLVQELAAQVYPEAAPQIPWIVLTSDATDVSTRSFFEKKEYFGLKESQVWFVKQDSLPCVDYKEGNAILLESPWKLAVAPTGNGGLFSALHAQNITDRLSEEGVQYVQVYSVDNALVRVGDPVFFGYAHEQKADVGVKVVKRTSSDEAVGVVCLQKNNEQNLHSEHEGTQIEDISESDETEEGDERLAINIHGNSISSHYRVLEYNEMPDALRTAKEGDDLVYQAAHICVNLFSVDYLKTLADKKLELGFHSALKRIRCMKKDESGEWTTYTPDQPNGVKLERFIFDAFKYCDSEEVALLEVNRNEEFAPIKNAVGPGIADTAETALDMTLALRNRSMSTAAESDQDGDNHNLSLLRAYIFGK